MIYLRFLTTYDENGRDSSESLQYWNAESGEWEDIKSVRVRFDDPEVTNPPEPWEAIGE